MVLDAIHAKGAGSSNGLDEGVLGEPGGMTWRASDCWRTTCTGDREISCGIPVNVNRRPELAKGRGGGLNPWTWRLAESSPREQVGELLLLLFKAKQGRSSDEAEAAAVGLGAGDGDSGEDVVLR